MGWSLGYDERWQRDIGYGVPAYCDHPGCNAEIDRGLAHVCCGEQPYGGSHGCGRYFCSEHQVIGWDEDDDEPTCGHAEREHVSPEHPDWVQWKLTEESWQQWRDENPDEVAKLQALPTSDTK